MNQLASLSPAANLRRRLRILALVVGGGLLFWLPVEDLSENWAILFAILISTLAVLALLTRLHPIGGRPWLVASLAGALAGLAVTPLALFLMAFKSGLHGHHLPDFTPAQVTSVLQRTPIWIAAGLLIGLGVGLWLSTHRNIPPTQGKEIG